MPSLSAILIAKNEEAHIGRALASLHGLADEIILVDSESTDRTVDIAKKFTEKIVTRAFEGFGAQKNFARGLATGDWILHIDADEEVSPALRDEIRTVIRNAAVDFLFLPVVTEFLGRPLTHLGGTNLRLFRRAAGQWDNKKVHEQIQRTSDHSTVRLRDEDTRLLTTPLTHHSHYQTLQGYFERQERYTTGDAEEMLRSGSDRFGRPVPKTAHVFSRVWRQFVLPKKQFLKLLLYRRGILDGWQGWLWCVVSAQYEHTMWRKYFALRRSRL